VPNAVAADSACTPSFSTPLSLECHRALLVLAETLGEWVAGQYAGTWPDIFEPGTSSYHRDFCHALAPTAYAATFAFQQVPTRRSV
jgi:hypothetical protein